MGVLNKIYNRIGVIRDKHYYRLYGSAEFLVKELQSVFEPTSFEQT